MAITFEEVEKTAALAQLEIPEGDRDRVVKALRSILDYADKLSEVDVTGVEPMAHVVLAQRLRDDEVDPCLTNEEALSGAAKAEPPFFAVPRIIEHDE